MLALDELGARTDREPSGSRTAASETSAPAATSTAMSLSKVSTP
jgi:hypothetical protein